MSSGGSAAVSTNSRQARPRRPAARELLRLAAGVEHEHHGAGRRIVVEAAVPSTQVRLGPAVPIDRPAVGAEPADVGQLARLARPCR